MNDVKIKFKNSNQAKAFMEWFSGQGEQDYFDYVDLAGLEGVIEFESDFNKNEIVGKLK